MYNFNYSRIRTKERLFLSDRILRHYRFNTIIRFVVVCLRDTGTTHQWTSLVLVGTTICLSFRRGVEHGVRIRETMISSLNTRSSGKDHMDVSLRTTLASRATPGNAAVMIVTARIHCFGGNSYFQFMITD